MDITLRTRAGPFTGSSYRTGLPPGLYEERAPRARPRLVRLDTAAFIGLAERGPVNAAVPVTSMPGFRAIFGEAVQGLLLPQAVGAFFNNGGRQCVVVRALDHAKARTASLCLPGLSPPVSIAARNPGAWANRLKLRVSLKRRTLPLRIAPAKDPDWPKDTLLAPAHRARTGVTVLLTGVKKPVPGALTGAVARIATATAARRGVAAITLSEPLPTGFKDEDRAALLLGTVELLLRLDIYLDDRRVEAWDDATFNSAHADFLPRLLGRSAPSEALLAPRISGGDELDLAWGTEDDPAGSEFLRPSLMQRTITLTPTNDLLSAPNGLLFDASDLETPYSGDDASQSTSRVHFFEPTPGDPADAPFGLHPFADRPGALESLSVWDQKNITSPIALVCMPDLLQPAPPDPAVEIAPVEDALCFGVCVHVPAVRAKDALPYPALGGGMEDLQFCQAKLVEHCEREGGRIALLDLPPGLRAGDIIGWRRALASDRAALIAPWLRAAPVDDPLGAAITLPPSAIAAGLIARVEQTTGVYASPGNQTIAGVFALAQYPGLPEAGFLHAERIDAVRQTEKGIQLMGSRTTSLDPDWTHINVRRVVDWLMAQLTLDLAWAPFEPNNPRLWSAMTRIAARRLSGLYEAGALAGDTAAQAWFARCDETTMTQSDLDNGRAIMLVGVAPAVPAEFLVFRLMREGRDDSVVSTKAVIA